MNQRAEELDKLVEKYSADCDRLEKQRREYENLIKKVKIEQREWEAKKRRDLEEFEKQKEEELGKVKKEKKNYEQRQKNLQLVNN